ncbi:Serine/threonine-protein phosphatase 2A regulatory subunit B'' subunit beta [Gonapodya sp. JEL0774]|nr:Serine/threonine-protein phosphatase 2A regulatory subunit B'' subunit beta [Gonapodya sp. JEL0774]
MVVDSGAGEDRNALELAQAGLIDDDIVLAQEGRVTEHAESQILFPATVPAGTSSTSLPTSPNHPSSAGDIPMKKDSGVDLVESGKPSSDIPRFHHPPGFSPLTPAEQESFRNMLLSRIECLFSPTTPKTISATENEFAILNGAEKKLDGTDLGELAKALGLPKYMGGAAGRFAMALDDSEDGVSRTGAERMCRAIYQYAHDPLLLSFYFLVRDVVRAHPGLQFLAGMQVFQARYVDTVVTRVWYGKGGRGDREKISGFRMTLAEWRRSGFIDVLKNLEEEEDVNATRDPFSYKHFYVTYCLFWTLDTDHDMVLNAAELASYDGHRITTRAMRRVAEGYGRKLTLPTVQITTSSTDAAITPLEATRAARKGWFNGWRKGDAEGSEEMAEAAAGAEDGEEGVGGWEEARFEYRDFVCFLMSVEDKSTPAAVEYWFRVIDTDGDGILSLHEIKYFFDEQRERTRPYVTLGDLKRCNNAGLFFDLLFDWKRYDARVRRMDPGFREQDDVWVLDKKLAMRVKLSGWDKFAERSYEALAYEEQVQQQSVTRTKTKSRVQGQVQGRSRSLRDGLGGTGGGHSKTIGRRRGARWSRETDDSDSEDEPDAMEDSDDGDLRRKSPEGDDDRMEVVLEEDS